MVRGVYNTATKGKGKYATLPARERSMVPLYFEFSPETKQINVQMYDPEQLQTHITKMLQSKKGKDLYNGQLGPALDDVRTYMNNLANNRPGETGIGLEKKGVINEMFGVNADANPYVSDLAQRPSNQSVWKTFRLDRINRIAELSGQREPVTSQTYEKVRSFMQPRTAKGGKIPPPEETPLAAGAAPVQFPEALPVTTRLDKDGKPQPVPIPYDITKSPLIAGKYPQKLAKDAPDRMSSQFSYNINPTEGRRLTAIDDASGVTTFVNKLVPMLKAWLKDPAIASGKEWYNTIGDKLKGAFGNGANQFMEFLAATSPMKRPHANFLEAYEAKTLADQGHYDRHIDLYNKARDMMSSDPEGFIQHVKGLTGNEAPTQAKALAGYIAHHDILPLKANGQKYGFNSEAVLRVLSGRWKEDVKGPKTPQFNKNITGENDDPTIDDWAARTLREIGYKGQQDQWRIQPASKTGVSNEDFAFGQLVFKRAAEKLGLKPKEAQALAWVGEQDKWVKNGWADIPSQSFDKPFDLAFPKKGPKLSPAQLQEALKK